MAAKKNKNRRSHRKTFAFPVLLFLLFQVSFLSSSAQSHTVDSLGRLLESKLEDTARVKVINKLADYLLLSRPDSSLLLAQKALVLSEKIKYGTGEADALNIKGLVYWVTGDYPNALQNYLSSLKIKENMNDRLGMALTYMNIGILYAEQKEYFQAIGYTRQSMFLTRSILDTNHYIITLVNLGDFFEKTNTLDSARYYTHQGYELAMKYHDLISAGAALTNLGNIHKKMKQSSLAMDYYRLAIPELQATGNDDAFCEATLGMAEIFQKSGETDSAEYYSRLSLNAAKAGGFTKRLLNSSIFMTGFFKSSGNIDSAFAYQQITLAAKDSLFSQEKVREVQNLSFAEEIRQQEITEAKERAAEERAANLQMAGMGAFIPLFFGLILLLGKKKVKPRIIEFMGLFGLLMLFELISLFLHPYVEALTHHTPIYMLLILVGIAAIILPLHHKLEHLVKEKLVHGRYLNFSEKEKKEIIAALEDEPVKTEVPQLRQFNS